MWIYILVEQTHKEASVSNTKAMRKKQDRVTESEQRYVWTVCGSRRRSSIRKGGQVISEVRPDF